MLQLKLLDKVPTHIPFLFVSHKFLCIARIQFVFIQSGLGEIELTMDTVTTFTIATILYYNSPATFFQQIPILSYNFIFKYFLYTTIQNLDYRQFLYIRRDVHISIGEQYINFILNYRTRFNGFLSSVSFSLFLILFCFFILLYVSQKNFFFLFYKLI